MEKGDSVTRYPDISKLLACLSLHNDAKKTKLASNDIKQIVTDLSSGENNLENQKPIPELFWKNTEQDSKQFLRFWAEYFEIYEVLDENQSHIIQPVLKEKLKIFNSLHENQDIDLCKWYLVILSKMMNHENRQIAKEGFLNALELGHLCKVNLDDDDKNLHLSMKNVLTQFLETRMLPMIRNHVGWIFADTDDYFDACDKFGFFICNVYSNDQDNLVIKVVGEILRYILKDGTCFSPVAVHFLVNSFRALEKEYLPKENNEMLRFNLEAFENWINLLIKFASRGLTAVDPFLKLEIEEILVRLYMIVFDIILIKQSPNFTVCSNPEKQQFGLKIISFLGAISFLEVLSKFSNDILELRLWLDKNFELLLGESGNKNPLAIKGMLRLEWIPILTDGDMLVIFTHLSPVLEAESVSRYDSNYIPKFLLQGSATNASVDGLKKCFVSICVALKVKLLSRLIHLLANEDPSVDNHSRLFREALDMLNLVNLVSAFEALELEKYIDILYTAEDFKFINSLIAVVLEHLTREPYSEFTEYVFWRTVASIGNCGSKNLKEVYARYIKHWESSDFKQDDEEENEEMIQIKQADPEQKSMFYIYKFQAMAKFLKGCDSQPTVDFYREFPENPWEYFIKVTTDYMDKGGYGAVESACKCIRNMFDYLMNYLPEVFRGFTMSQLERHEPKYIFEYLNISWNLVFELRKTDAFWSAVDEFTTLISHPVFTGWNILSKFAEKLLEKSEEVLGLSLVLMKNIQENVVKKHLMLHCESNFEDSMLKEAVSICLRGCLIGPPLPKNSRVVFGIWEKLFSKVEKEGNLFYMELYNNSIFTKTSMARLTALGTLQFLLTNLRAKHFEIRDLILEVVLTFLINAIAEGSDKNYYGGSVLHRRRLRTFQAVLILQPYFDKGQTRSLFTALMKALCIENMQPSIRYLLEWSIIRIMSSGDKLKDLWTEFFTLSEKAISTRIAFGTAFSSVCFHVCNCFEQNKKHEYFFSQSLKFLSQLILGHNITVKTYAQACFQKLYTKLSFPHLISKYQVMYDSLQAAQKFGSGNSAKMTIALENDFYIQQFNPVTHYTTEVIFIYLPHISKVSTDELPTHFCLEKSGVFAKCPNNSSLSPKELKELYDNHEKDIWHLKTNPGVGGQELGEEMPIIVGQEKESKQQQASQNYQKKINPWKSLTISESAWDEMSEDVVLRKKSSVIEEGLVLVASLIDRIPNLGGLCRSCEIFGVSKYVIPSMKILEDQEFKTVAVSAHNWVNILEVPPRDLESFLKTYKAKGYSILGIEQTQESVRLNDFQFPKKSLLLLGHEKYGIPGNLLELVDSCLEIPQVGIIRSLNVHVTGALCIWQYSTQHSIQKK